MSVTFIYSIDSGRLTLSLWPTLRYPTLHYISGVPQREGSDAVVVASLCSISIRPLPDDCGIGDDTYSDVLPENCDICWGGGEREVLE
jgi:hypothetical protein